MDSLLNTFSRPRGLDSCSVRYGLLLGVIAGELVRLAFEIIRGRETSLTFTIVIILTALIGHAVNRRMYLNCKKSSV